MTTKTFRLSGKAMDRTWHVIDARGQPLGRLASEAARLLMGKHKATYEPYLPMGDFVIIVNAREVAVTGKKSQQKVYYRHSGYPGGLKQRTFQEQMDRDPRRVVERAIKGMLPSTSLGRELFRHLKVYAGPTHPHEAQVRAGAGASKKQRTEAAAGAPLAGAQATAMPAAAPETVLPEDVAAPVVPEAAAEEPATEAAAQPDATDTEETPDTGDHAEEQSE